MKKYYSIDRNIKISIIGLLICILIPFIGPYIFGTRFTTMYTSEVDSGRIILLFSTIFHVYLLIKLFI